MDQYLHISADTAKNIAILKIQDTDNIIESEDIRKKLQTIIEEYYGNPVKVHSLEQLDENFIEVKVVVTIGNDEQDSWAENIYLNETWLY